MFLSLIFLWMPVLIFSATAAEFKTHLCELNTTSHINNTIFYSNLIQVLDSLALDTFVSDKQFLYNSTGIQPNIAYGLYLCRADVLPNDCRNCLLKAREDINKSCFLSKAAVSWSDNCMLRYANYSMVSVMNSATFVPECNKVNISDQTRFWHVATNFMGQLATHVLNDPEVKHAYDELPYNDGKIYGYVQCTPDLSGSDCNKCLQTNIDRLSQYCYGKEGARVLAASCDVRFEIYKFLQFPVASSQKQDAGKKKIPSKIIAGIAAVGFLVVATAICFLFFVQKRFRPNTSCHELKDETDETEIMTEQSLQFELDTILEATNNFSIENKVGEGGFGVVYKGILPNGLEIAVKRLSKSSGQGSLEFKNEVVLLAKLQHRNLVRLLGFCLHAEEKILIYEYVANHSLDFFLFGPTKDVKLDWSSRYRIIGGIARGMLYLHEDSRLRIIHRDLKASNVLLDEEMNPKISDFGMARIVCGSQTQAMTNRIVGTFGYMSPEYAMHGHFSVKSDVFSFGVLVLEIISGKRNTRIFESGYTDLLCYAWSKWKNAEAMEILDSNMVDSSLENEALRCINIALLCVQEDDELRPSMASVVLMLNSYSIALSVPQNPPFVSRKRVKYTSDLLESDNSVCTVWHTDATAITDVDPR
ncbi:putative protein kinase RLK-Pelle-DLSV family [Helianthus annuus]|uniref:Putative cysteine-rich RLK (RECEPTOR-like protein kinase) 5 n=1 Tax=Helianthus annuus TaxID=4232 RepID=A0A251VPK1_HELAN|nr:cysteine-rich receptor-like protein kinase 5 isoform X1 [Helianthus annuus]KAF5821856.1 putative protein kinase RLK-Pelle-DLSV family [Helianthus annuus]KAJ0611464.1 putative protein kinase RLK-Pelle-DLSV family [Helianthus annuus]KAJ0622514.1 putative protein kinase RLK-Pelle-DLSV family [Helianthus annuus]KAJ0626763.1 putative protein kinase RLK-Pelle-DLSV family [Helianthus annuus]KAJ0783110.1 putative protein kinase RLK-Pelle-DLSV family [Helianthus annuus]